MDADHCELLCLDLPAAEAARTALPDVAELEARATRAKGLADPTRLQLAAALREAGELCVCDLAWISGRSEKLVSHHARTLKASGLVASRREGKMVLYTLTDAGRAILAVVLPDVEVTA